MKSKIYHMRREDVDLLETARKLAKSLNMKVAMTKDGLVSGEHVSSEYWIETSNGIRVDFMDVVKSPHSVFCSAKDLLDCFLASPVFFTHGERHSRDVCIRYNPFFKMSIDELKVQLDLIGVGI